MQGETLDRVQQSVSRPRGLGWEPPARLQITFRDQGYNLIDNLVAYRGLRYWLDSRLDALGFG